MGREQFIEFWKTNLSGAGSHNLRENNEMLGAYALQELLPAFWGESNEAYSATGDIT